MSTSIIRKSISLFLLFTFILTFFSSAAFAQRRVGRTAAPDKKQTAKVPIEKSEEACDGWRGKITYVQQVNDEKYKNKGEFGYEKYTRIIQINGEAVLTGGKSGASKVSVLTKDIMDTEDRRRADCGDWMSGTRKNTFVEKYYTEMSTIGEATGGASPSISIDNGNFVIDLNLPAARGKSMLQGKHSQKGYCTASADNEETTNPVEQPKQFDSIRVYAEGKVDPKAPNTLHGAAQYADNVTVSWDLTRTTGGECDEGNLSVTGVKLEHHVYPNPTAWEQIGENTIDGNQVKITATVSNSSKKPKSGTVIFKETTSGETIGAKGVNVPGGSEAEVDVTWDTNGFAWTDNKKNAPQREIEASLMDGGDSLSEKVWVHPKPVILVHGLWSNGAAWAEYHNYLEEAHSFAWKAYAVGADPKVAEMHTGDHFGNVEPTFSIRQNAQELAKQILYTQKTENAWHVDIVAHSMGGLISRFYINGLMPDSPDGKPLVKNLVMLGTPNQGSPWADIMFKKYEEKGFHVEALRELKTDVCRTFNSLVTNRKGVKFAIVYTDKVPFTGDTMEPGDGVVSYSSAVWQISDVSRSDSWEHTALTGKQDFMRFVYPRLALGPKRAKQMSSVNENFQSFPVNRLNLIEKNWLAATDPREALTSLFPEDTVKSVSLKPNETLELNIPTTKSKRGGITFFAPSSVSATLTDADGEVLGENTAGSTEATAMFRYIVVDHAVASGNWKLKIENTGDTESSIVIVPVFDTNPLVLEFTEIQVQNSGAVSLQAKLTNESGVVKGAAVTAKVQGDNKRIVLLDDGSHNDGAANDGVYGASTEKIDSGEHLIEAQAAVNGYQVTVSTVLTVGGAN